MIHENNRKNERKGCFVPVEGKKGTSFENTKTLDVSQAGIGFVSDREVTVNEQIAVEMELASEGDSVVKMGKVKWVEQIPGSDYYRFGMQLKENF